MNNKFNFTLSRAEDAALRMDPEYKLLDFEDDNWKPNKAHSEWPADKQILSQAEKMNEDSLKHLSSAKQDIKKAMFIMGLATIIAVANVIFVFVKVLS